MHCILSYLNVNRNCMREIGFDTRSLQTQAHVVKTGSDSSAAKRLAMGMSGVLEDDHYKRMSRVTVGVPRLTA